MKRKLLFALFTFLLLVSLLTPTSFAVAADGEYVEWEVSDDWNTLTDGYTVYTRVALPQGYTLDNIMFCYANSIYNDDEYCPVVSATYNSDIIYVYRKELLYAYANEEGMTKLKSYLDGNYETARLFSPYDYEITVVSNELITSLDALSGSGVLTDVSTLKDCMRYEIRLYNHEDNLTFTHGAIYKVDDDYYYLNYELLDNSHFDSSGTFSYRAGTVELIPISDALLPDITSYLASMEIYDLKVKYEYRDDYQPVPPGFSINWTKESSYVALIIITVILGIALPALPITLSLITLFKKRTDYPIPSYILFAVSAVWEVLGIAVLILLLV